MLFQIKSFEKKPNIFLHFCEFSFKHSLGYSILLKSLNFEKFLLRKAKNLKTQNDTFSCIQTSFTCNRVNKKPITYLKSWILVGLSPLRRYLTPVYRD